MELNSLVKITSTMQGIQTLIIGLILLHFYFTYRKNYLLLWALSWFAYAVYFIGGIAGFALAQSLGSTHPARIAIASFYLSAGYLQVPLLLFGAYQLVTGRKISRPLLNSCLIAAVLIGIILAFGSAFASQPQTRFFLRVSVHAVVFGVAFVLGSLILSRIWNPKPLAGRVIVLSGFFVYGIYQFMYALLPFAQPSLNEATATITIYFVLTETILMFWTGLGLIVWLFEDERARAVNAVNALKVSEELFRKLTENNTAGIFVLQDLVVKYANPTAAGILKQKTGEIIEQPFLEFVHSSFQNRIARNYEKLVAGKSVPRGEVSLVNRRGDEFWCDMTGTAIEFQARPAALVTAVDITEHKAAEERLRQTQKLESIGMLAGGIAHDFNNMLTGMTGYAELALRKIPADAPVRRNLERIRNLCGRAGELTKQLLAFARRQVLAPEVINLNDIAAETTDFLRRVIGANIEIEMRLDSDLRTVNADPTQIQQVITNLALNGRDAMPDGGKLSITTRNIEQTDVSRLHDSIAVAAPYIELSVTDTGKGMSPETRERIFEPFFTTKELGRGTGLGLSIVYGIVKQHNGTITVESKTGAGSNFKIYLPAANAAAEAHKLPERFVERNGDGTILLAEDEQIVRELVTEVLMGESYRVLSASDGAEALELYERHKDEINLVITDAVMPHLGGEEVFKFIRERNPDLRFLFISGYGLELTDPHSAHHTELLRKPFKNDALLEKVRLLLSHNGQN